MASNMVNVLNRVISAVLTLSAVLYMLLLADMPLLAESFRTKMASIGTLESRVLEFSGRETLGLSHEEFKLRIQSYVERSFKAMVEEDDEQIQFSEQKFRPYSTKEHTIGRNYILTIPGQHYKTDKDKVYLLTAHYATLSGNITVDGEGSGMTALLETIIYMSSLRRAGCVFKNTLVAVAFDFSAQYMSGEGVTQGSEAFIKEVLPGLISKDAQFGRAYVLGSVLNYQNTPESQTMPDGFAMLPVPLVKALTIHQYTGDFILGLSRHEPLLAAFLQQWNTTTTWDSCREDRLIPLARSMKLEDVPGLGTSFPLHLTPLLFDEQGQVVQPVHQVVQDYPWLLYGDHMVFWTYNQGGKQRGQGLPAVFLTDTANLRHEACYRQECNTISWINAENLRFLLRSIRTLAATLVDLCVDQESCTDRIAYSQVICAGERSSSQGTLTLTVLSLVTLLLLRNFHNIVQ